MKEQCVSGGTYGYCNIANGNTDCLNQPTCRSSDKKCAINGDGKISCALGSTGDSLCSAQTYGCNGKKCQLGGTGTSCNIASGNADCASQPTCRSSDKKCVANGDGNISCALGSMGDSLCSAQTYGCNGNKCQLGGTGMSCDINNGDGDCASQPTCRSSDKKCAINGDGNVSCSIGDTGDTSCSNLSYVCVGQKCQLGQGGQSCTKDSDCATTTKCNTNKVCDPQGGGASCAMSNLNSDCINVQQPPNATNLSVDKPSYCDGSIIFHYTYTDPQGYAQSKYELQIATTQSFLDAQGNSTVVYDSCFSNGGVGCASSLASGQRASLSVYVEPPSSPTGYCKPFCNFINYGVHYYWRVQVWASTTGYNSGEVNYTDATSNPVNTYIHPYSHPGPMVSYSFPATIYPKIITKFTDSSTCYHDNGSTYPCLNGDSNTYAWWLENSGNASPDSTAKVSTISHTYALAGAYTSKLKICDGTAPEYCCSLNQGVPVGNPENVPQWKEISPY